MTIDRRSLLAGALAAGVASAARAQTAPPASDGPLPPGLPQPHETIDLWPGGAPGMPTRPPEEQVIERSEDVQTTDRAVLGITKPRLAVFRPNLANGAAIMIAPGGGYHHVVIDKEGYELGRWFAARGFTVFVLFYRLPGEGWANGPDVALADAQRAIRLIRHRAGNYGVDPDRVAVMGFSAGGHVCADLATRFATRTYTPVDEADELGTRPRVAAPIYPVVSMSLPVAHAGSRELLIGANASKDLEHRHSPQLNVPDNAPPCFLVHAEDDPAVPVENTLLLRAALAAQGIPTETHLFTYGGHGFGLRRAVGKPAGAWPGMFLRWSQSMGLVNL